MEIWVINISVFNKYKFHLVFNNRISLWNKSIKTLKYVIPPEFSSSKGNTLNKSMAWPCGHLFCRI